MKGVEQVIGNEGIRVNRQESTDQNKEPMDEHHVTYYRDGQSHQTDMCRGHYKGKNGRDNCDG